MSRTRAERPWLDELHRKHECGPSLSDYRTIEVIHEGETLRVQIPDNLNDPERLEIRATVRTRDLLVLLGYHTQSGRDLCERGILMVARQEDEGSYTVHVFHEMYPWALTHLGLGDVIGDP
jgi:trans-aconitate methyltransferase